MKRTIPHLAAALLIALALTLAQVPRTSHAAIYCVDNNSDGPPNAADCPVDCLMATGQCTLRDAIEAANADASEDEIQIPEGTITLSEVGDDEESNASGDLDILEQVSLQGEGMNDTIILWDAALSDDDKDRIFDVDPSDNDISVQFNGFGIQGGYLNQNGMMNAEGGAGVRISTPSSLILQNVLVDSNQNQVDQSTRGGGILCKGTLAIVQALVSNNKSQSGGAGIAVNGTCRLAAVGLTLSGNQVLGGGIGAGGMFLANGSTWSLNNSTISGNIANGSGGGLINDGTGNLINVTISKNIAQNNTGGGFRNQSGNLTIVNCIVAQNTAAISSPDCDAQNAVTSGGSNLIGDGSGCTGVTNGINNDQVGNQAAPIDAQLGPLADNGGFTPTHLLLAGSPAIDASDPSDCPPPNEDQRGQTRPAGARCDIGAVELGAVNLSVSLQSDTPGPVNPGDTVVYTWQVENLGPETDFVVSVDGTLPVGAVLLSASPADSCTITPEGFRCEVGTLAATESGTGSVSVTLNTPGTNTLMVAASGSEMESDPNDNSASVSIQVVAPPAPPPLISGGGCGLTAMAPLTEAGNRFGFGIAAITLALASVLRTRQKAIKVPIGK